MKNFKKNQGFNLIEVMAAIFVISMGIVGLMSLLMQAAQVQYTNKNNLIAAQLGQECAELIRNKRDNNWFPLVIGDWDSGLDAGLYKIDYSGTFSSVSSISEASLNIDSNGFYRHGAGSPSIFFRTVSIARPSEDEIKFICRIEWNERNNLKYYETEAWLNAWYDWE